EGGRLYPRGDRVPGPARDVDSHLAAQACGGDGPPAGRAADVLAAAVDGVAGDQCADPAGGCAEAAPLAAGRTAAAGDPDRTGRLDQRELRRAGLRYRFSDLCRPLVAADGFP